MSAQPAALPRTFEEIADQIVVFLANEGAIPTSDRPTPWAAFERLSALVHDSFEPAPTAMSPMMRRLLFALSTAARPRRVVGVGTFTAYGFSWLVRSAVDPDIAPAVEHAVGIDVDPETNRAARRNSAILGHGDRLTFLDDDGVAALTRWTDPIDLLYLDADDPERGKGIYTDMLEAALPVLRAGALIVAHDPIVPKFEADFERFHDMIRSSSRFLGPWVFRVDPCGVSVASYRGDAS